MTVTVSGLLLRRDHMAAHYDQRGGLVDAYRIDVGGLTLAAGRIRVDLDHDGRPVGELVRVEQVERGDVHAVAVVEVDELADLGEPVYWSVDWEYSKAIPGRSCWVGRAPKLLGVSLVLAPAQRRARPVSIRRGDVRQPFDTYRWPIGWRHGSGVLARAAHHAGEALQLRHVDRRGQPLDTDRGPDKMTMHHSRHLGRVLAVR
jgi:hypothetical protein